MCIFLYYNGAYRRKYRIFTEKPIKKKQIPCCWIAQSLWAWAICNNTKQIAPQERYGPMSSKTMMYILKRLALAILTVWVVITVTFFVMRAVPGGPFLGEKAISPAATVSFAWEVMQKENLGSMPVVDEDGKLYAMISATDIASNSYIHNV